MTHHARHVCDYGGVHDGVREIAPIYRRVSSYPTKKAAKVTEVRRFVVPYSFTYSLSEIRRSLPNARKHDALDRARLLAAMSVFSANPSATLCCNQTVTVDNDACTVSGGAVCLHRPITFDALSLDEFAHL